MHDPILDCKSTNDDRHNLGHGIFLGYEDGMLKMSTGIPHVFIMCLDSIYYTPSSRKFHLSGKNISIVWENLLRKLHEHWTCVQILKDCIYSASRHLHRFSTCQQIVMIVMPGIYDWCVSRHVHCASWRTITILRKYKLNL